MTLSIVAERTSAVMEVEATSNTSATIKSHYLFVQGDNGLMWST